MPLEYNDGKTDTIWAKEGERGKITFSGAISDSMILVLYLLHLQLNY